MVSALYYKKWHDFSHFNTKSDTIESIRTSAYTVDTINTALIVKM